MIRRPPRSTRTDTLFPYTTLFRSDLGYLADGEIVITGRTKDLIIVNGRNILPQDLEWTAEGEVAALRSGDVAAFSVHDDNGERVVVLFECRSNDPQLREPIGAEIAGVLPARHSSEEHTSEIQSLMRIPYA